MNLKFNRNIFKNKHIYTYFFFLIIFFIGIKIFKDFGLFGDEPIHQWIGSIYYSHIKELILNFNYNNEHIAEINRLATDDNFKFWIVYPIFFDLLTQFFVDILNIQTSKSIFEIRHLTLFFIFFLSLIYFYKLSMKRFKNFYLSLLGVLLIFFSPRIFAESFYNSKDIIFLSLSIINIYFSLKFIDSQKTKNLILYSLSAGLLINSRIMGLIYPILTFSIILFETVDNDKVLIAKIKKLILSSFLILFTVMLFWPYLWSDTINNLAFYLSFLKKLAVYSNTYFGETILSNNTPWHFKFVWISITIPMGVLIFSVSGFLIMLYMFFNRIILLEKNNQLWMNTNESYDFLIFLLLSFPLAASLIYKNNFDGWRHYYYVYPLLVYHSLYFLNKIKNKHVILYKSLNFLIILNLIINVQWMIKFHPHQYTYFNSIQKNLIKKDFNVDYVGQSIKHSLKYILEKDNRDLVKVSGLGEVWIKGSSLILNETSKSRLDFVNLQQADYIIDIYRPRIGKKSVVDLKRFTKYYDLVIDDKIVNTIYKKR